MSNPLFGMMQQQQTGNNLMQKFQQFRQMFKGDANRQIQQMMNTGRINQQQYNQAVQMANQFKQMFGGK